MDRRTFLATTMTLSLGALAANQPRLRSFVTDLFAGPTEWAVGPYYLRKHPQHKYLAITNLKTEATEFIRIPCGGHSVIAHAFKPWTLIVIPKASSTAVELDLRSLEVTTIAATIGANFYGHSAFSADGKVFIHSEFSPDPMAHSLILRDPVTYQVLGKMPSYGIRPHDFTFVDEGKRVLVANSGVLLPNEATPASLRTNVSLVEVASGKLLHQYTSDEKGFEFAHVLETAAEDIIVGTFPRPERGLEIFGSVFLARKGAEQIQNLSIPEAVRRQLRDQSLSLALSPRTGILAVTSPDSNLILFWNAGSGEFIKSLPLRGACGVVVNASDTHFIVSGVPGRMERIDNKTLELEPCLHAPRSFSNTAHLLHLKLNRHGLPA